MVALSIGVWMFIGLLRIKQVSEMSYIGMVMALNILVMLDTGITAAAAWSAGEMNFNIQPPQVTINLL